MFADEARFGRINRPRPCWAPTGIRPEVAAQLIREYIYLYGAVAPKDGTCVYLIMPTSNTACFQIFLDILARKFARQDILLVLDGAPKGLSINKVVNWYFGAVRIFAVAQSCSSSRRGTSGVRD